MWYVSVTNMVVVYYRTRSKKKPIQLRSRNPISEHIVVDMGNMCQQVDQNSITQNSGLHRRIKNRSKPDYGSIKRNGSAGDDRTLEKDYGSIKRNGSAGDDRTLEKSPRDIRNENYRQRRTWDKFNNLKSSLLWASGFGEKPRGLKNNDSICFINAALQCLAYTTPLAEYLSNDFIKDINTENSFGTKGEIVITLSMLIKEMRSSGSKAVDPKDFVAKVRQFGSRFDNHDEHDLQEFLVFLLDKVQEDVNRVKQKSSVEKKDPHGRPDEEVADECWSIQKLQNDSVIDEIFQVLYRSKLCCLVCKEGSITFDPCMYLSLPIPSKVNTTDISFTSCLEEFLVGDDSIDADNLWICPRCNIHRSAKKTIDLWRLEVIVFQLKRIVRKGDILEKVDSYVSFPMRLDLSPYVKSKEAFGGTCVYGIYAVCNHYGSLAQGHYRACCKIMGTWYDFDDTRVSQVREGDLQTSAAYLLFYQRVKRDQKTSSKTAPQAPTQQNVGISSSTPSVQSCCNTEAAPD